MKNKYWIQLSLMIVALPLAVTAKPEIPKMDLAVCEINKEIVRNWFVRSYTDKKDLQDFYSATPTMLLKVQQAAPAGNAKVANYYKIALHGFHPTARNARGKKKIILSKNLEQLAVTHGPGLLSVGYSPYDVGDTRAEAFSLLIEDSGSQPGDAKGHMAFVAIQSTRPNPLQGETFPCRYVQDATKPAAISRAEFDQYSASEQAEIIYNLSRVGGRGSIVTVGEHAEKLAQIGLNGETLKRVQTELSEFLDARALPKATHWGKYELQEKPEPAGERCGGVKVGYVTPIYDSLTTRDVKAKVPGTKEKAIGYILTDVRCNKPARTVTATKVVVPGEEPEAPSDSTDTWRAEDVVISSAGFLGPDSFIGARFDLR